MATYLWRFILAAFLVVCVRSSFIPDDDDDDGIPPLSHERVRRFIRFHSKAHPDAEPEKGIGFRGHLINLLKGGSLGVEFELPVVAKKVSDLREKEKRDWEEVERRENSIPDYGGFINPRLRP